MFDWIVQYPYLTSTLILLAALGVVYALLLWQRGALLVCCLLSAPLCVTNLYLTPKYWDPVLIIDLDVGVGIEDVLFCSSFGGLIWAAGAGPIQRQIVTNPRWRVVLGRYAACVAISLALNALMLVAGLGAMDTCLLTSVVVAAALIVHRPGLWRLAVWGPLLLTGPYLLGVWAMLAMSPQYIHQWNAENLWGIYLAGVPLEEVAFGAVAASASPVYFGYALDVRIASTTEQEPAHAR